MEDCYDSLPKKKILFLPLKMPPVTVDENCKVDVKVKECAILVKPTQKITRPKRKKITKPKTTVNQKKSSSEIYDFIDH